MNEDEKNSRIKTAIISNLCIYNGMVLSPYIIEEIATELVKCVLDLKQFKMDGEIKNESPN